MSAELPYGELLDPRDDILNARIWWASRRPLPTKAVPAIEFVLSEPAVLLETGERSDGHEAPAADVREASRPAAPQKMVIHWTELTLGKAAPVDPVELQYSVRVEETVNEISDELKEKLANGAWTECTTLQAQDGKPVTEESDHNRRVT